MNSSPEQRRRTILAWAFARIDVRAFALASAAAFALVLFSLTVAIAWKGAPPGAPVGPHLAQLAAYFPGYSVSGIGALAGAAYAGAIGSVCGLVLATLWNLAHSLLLGVIRVRANLSSYSID
jgi:hypothetical protein